jgi:hypothetical protein
VDVRSTSPYSPKRFTCCSLVQRVVDIMPGMGLMNLISLLRLAAEADSDQGVLTKPVSLRSSWNLHAVAATGTFEIEAISIQE